MNNTPKTTLILGATPNPDRYAYKAFRMLRQAGHPVFPVGIKKAQIEGVDIINDYTPIERVHTITLYLNPKNQEQFYDYIIQTKPNRIVFNPGTENPVLEDLANKNGIETIDACTLVMLSIGNY